MIEQTSLAPTQMKVIEAKLRLENQFRGGASNFFWVAGLSLLNSLSALMGASWSFFIGLAVTQIIDGVALAFIPEFGAQSETIIKAIALVLDVAIAGFFVGIGFLARKKIRWVYIAGMVLYGLDGLLLILFQDFLGVGFHLLILFLLFSGYRVLGKLAVLEGASNPTDPNVMAVITPLETKRKISPKSFFLSIAIFLVLFVAWILLTLFGNR